MNQKSRTLLLQTLIEKEACGTERDLFQTKFGTQVDITVALCVSVSEEFDFGWAVYRLLSPTTSRKCDEMRRIAWAEGSKVRHAAWVKCLQAGQTLAAMTAYAKLRQASWTKCRQKIAAAFAECYIDGDGA